MSANLVVENDASAPITSTNYGSIGGGDTQQKKFRVENQGDQPATSVQVFLQRLLQNDGLDFSQLALDVNGNAGAYQSGLLNLGTLSPGDVAVFWVQVSVPNGTSPAGNPRQFDIIAEYSAT